MKKIMSVVLICLACATITACKTRTIENPNFIFVNKNIKDVENAIYTSLNACGWVSKQEGKNSILASYTHNGHKAKIRIEYTTNVYFIKYVGSDDLNYSKDSNGIESIHKVYNEWVESLAENIDNSLKSDSVTSLNSQGYNEYKSAIPPNETYKAPKQLNLGISDQLRKLKDMKESKLITDTEYEQKRKELVDQL